MKDRSAKDQNRIQKTKRRSFLIAVAEIFGIASVISLGLSAWVADGGSTGTFTGGVNVGQVVQAPPEDLDVITINALQGYSYAAGYGFVNDGVYADNIALTGTCTFHSAYGKRCFDSFVNNNSFQLDVELTTALSGGFAAQGFTSTNITLSSSNFATLSETPTTSDTISHTFTIVCSSNAADFTFTFSINLTYGNALTGFPNMSSAALNVSLTPKENAE